MGGEGVRGVGGQGDRNMAGVTLPGDGGSAFPERAWPAACRLGVSLFCSRGL